MVIIAGCVIVRDGKILMVQEAQKKAYMQWNFPAGHVDEGETIMEAATREAYEETGCKVKLTGVLPISFVDVTDGDMRLMVRFTAEVIEENIKFDPKEILDVKWLDFEKVKSMSPKELRGYDTSISYLKNFEENKIYPLDIFDETIYKR